MTKRHFNTLVAASSLALGAILPAVADASPLSGTNLWTTSGYATESMETTYTVPAGSSMSSANLFIGKYNSTAEGNLTITDIGVFTPQSRATIQVGSSAGPTSVGGQAALIVSNGGTISNTSSDFYINIGGWAGAGGQGGAGLFALSNSTVRSYWITVGGGSSNSVVRGGDGSIVVNSGGILNSSYLDIAVNVAVGSGLSGTTGPKGAGSVRINSGGTINVSNDIKLGGGDVGSVASLVVDGGVLNASSITIADASKCSLSISNGGRVTTTGEFLVTGNGNGVLISSGGTLTCQGALNIHGMQGSNDITTVTLNGGTLNTTAATEIGAAIDGTSSKLIIGNGSTYNNSGALGFAVTNFGMPVGSMQVKSGGVFNLLTSGSVYQHSSFYNASPFGKLITIDAGGVCNFGYNGATSVSVSFGSGIEIANNGLINFCQSDALSLSASISGTGTVAQIGTGTTTLSGANTYTGGTTVSAGTLAFSSISNLGTGPLALKGGTAKYTGTGPLSVSQLNVSGNTTSYFLTTQDTSITDKIDVLDGSRLVVGSASTPTTLTIAQNASMLGAVTVYGTLVNRGTITPNDPQIVNVTNFVNQGGTVNIAIAGNGAPGTVNGYDQIKYSGAATINGGVLKITLLNGYTPAAGAKFAFLQGGEAPTGAFSQVSLPALPTGLYGVILVGANDMEYAVLEGSVTNSGGTQSSVPAPIAALSPVGLVAMDALVIDEGRATANFLRSRAQADIIPKNDADWSAFAAVHGSNMTWGGGSDAGVFDQSYYGGKAGLANQLTDGFTLGLAFGYDNGSATLHDSLGQIDQDRGSVTAYTTVALGRSGFLYAGLTGGYSYYTSERTTMFGAKDGKTTGIDVGGSIGIGNTFELGGNWFTTPYSSATYTINETAEFTETGSINDAMEIARHAKQSLRVRIGDDFGYSFGALRLSFGAAYERECLDSTSTINAAYANGIGAFEVTGKTLSQDTIIATLNATWAIAAHQSVSMCYAYDYGLQGSSANSLNVAYTLRF